MAKKKRRKRPASKTASKIASKTAVKRKRGKPSASRRASAAKPARAATTRGLRARAARDPFLGHAAAVTIVCGCANTEPANLGRTLQELGVAGQSFQVCVFNEVTAAGCTITPDAIPDSADTMLIAAVNVIQTAPRTP